MPAGKLGLFATEVQNMADEITVLNTFTGAVLGFAAAVFAEPLRHKIYRPRLKLEFRDEPGFRARTPEEGQIPATPVPKRSAHEAEYVRVKVTNRKSAIAKGCRAYLVAIEKPDKDGAYSPTIYCDSIPLAWACRNNDAYAPLDLPRGVAQFIDLLSTRSISEDFRPEINPTPFRYIELFKEHGEFRFTIQVSGENVKPVFIRVGFRWEGVWDKYEAWIG